MKHHFIRVTVLGKVYIGTEDHHADMLTMPLNANYFGSMLVAL